MDLPDVVAVEGGGPGVGAVVGVALGDHGGAAVAVVEDLDDAVGLDAVVLDGDVVGDDVADLDLVGGLSVATMTSPGTMVGAMEPVSMVAVR